MCGCTKFTRNDSALVKTNLDMDVLRTLVVANDLGGFAKAANRLGRTQSAISLQMKKLEEQVGKPLFKKNGRGVGLTDAGDILLSYARRILVLNDDAVAATRGVAVEGTVRLGLPQDLAERWLPPILSHFHRTHPHIHLEVQVGRGRDLREYVAQGLLDLALAFGEIEQKGFTSDVLARIPMVWVGQKDFKVNDGVTLSLALLEAPCMFRQYGMQILDEAKIPWRIAFTSPSLSGLWGAIEAAVGITIRTPLGVSEGVTILNDKSGLPPLSTVPLALHQSAQKQTQAVERLKIILLESLLLNLPAGTEFPKKEKRSYVD